MEISRGSRPPNPSASGSARHIIGRTVQRFMLSTHAVFLFSPMKTAETVDAIKNPSRDPKLKLGENEKADFACGSKDNGHQAKSVSPVVSRAIFH